MSDIATKLTKIAERQPVLYDNGVSDGKQAEYDAFWDAYQQGGTRSSYLYAFAGPGWTNSTFKPKYSISPSVASNMFATSGLTGDLDEIIGELGITLSFSNTTLFNSTFANSKFEAIGEIDMRKATGFTGMFTSCTNLKRIKRIYVSSTQSLSNLLNYCTQLEEVEIVGSIGKSGFMVSSCTNLTHDSLLNIIGALADFSSSSSTYKVTLGSTNLAKLSEEEKLSIEAKGWTYA